MAGDTRPGGQDETLTRERSQVVRPPMYRVLLHNDDYTTMEFVVEILIRFFHLDEPGAYAIMMSVHHHGVGVAGLFTREVAETKVAQVTAYARRHEHPLKCTMEPV